MLALSVPDEQLNEAVMTAVKKLDLVPRESKRAKKISLDEFRKAYCFNHSKTWVRIFIFDEFPETAYQEGGWAMNPSGKEPGIRGTWIYEEKAAKWLDQHDDEIDWSARLAH